VALHSSNSADVPETGTQKAKPMPAPFLIPWHWSQNFWNQSLLHQCAASVPDLVAYSLSQIVRKVISIDR